MDEDFYQWNCSDNHETVYVEGKLLTTDYETGEEVEFKFTPSRFEKLECGECPNCDEWED